MGIGRPGTPKPELGMVAPTCPISTEEPEAGGLPDSKINK